MVHYKTGQARLKARLFLSSLVLLTVFSKCQEENSNEKKVCNKENLYAPLYEHCFYEMPVKELRDEADRMYGILKKYNGTEANLDFTYYDYEVLCDRKDIYGCQKTIDLVNFYCRQNKNSYSIFERYLVYYSKDSVKEYFKKHVVSGCTREVNVETCGKVLSASGCDPCFFACNLKYKPPKMDHGAIANERP